MPMTTMIDCGSPFSMMSQDIIAWHGIPGNKTDILPAYDLNGNRIQLYQCHQMAVGAIGTDETSTLDAVTVFGANITGYNLILGLD